MKKLYQIVLLESNKQNSLKPKDYNNTLVKNYTTNKLDIISFRDWNSYTEDHIQSQFIYIVSDIEIKQGEYYFDDFKKEIRKAQVNLAIGAGTSSGYYYKVIASTNKSITPNSYINLVESNIWIIEYYNKYKKLPEINENQIEEHISNGSIVICKPQEKLYTKEDIHRALYKFLEISPIVIKDEADEFIESL